ncbi:PASTA domain-containing protein [Streptomyces sp. SCSIO 75703]|uniref:PASTA domain-containing protein n=1 Tax=Streptomyces sp. SCSIO 75703 TaxID=3112165 RepID=UPI0030D1E498
MRVRVPAVVASAVLAGCLTACEPDGGAGPAGSPAVSRPADDKLATEAPAAVPDVVGMGLQSAQDTAQEAGFHVLTSHDALGRDRMQVLDRNWKVCGQSVAAGRSVPTDTPLDFGAVKLEESCPAKERPSPDTADGRMPDFTGGSVKAARAALDSATSLTVEDVSGQGRWVLVESNWRVCAQDPAAGTEIKGRPVELRAVKYGESCP